MQIDYEKLKKCVIFKNIDEKNIAEIFKGIHPKIENYSKNQTIAFEGDQCKAIGIVLDGQIEIQKLYLSGKTVVISTLEDGDIFGEVIVFSKMGVYPSTIISATKGKVLFINKDDIVKMCSLSDEFLKNFMELLSNKILMLNKKIKNLSFDTLREKVCSYILDEYQKQKSKEIILPHSRKEMAENLGVQRPSLSREFAKMKEEGLIDFNMDNVTIIDINALEDYIF